MEGSAPKEILQYTSQHELDLHQGVSRELTKTGQPATPQSVNPHDQSQLEGLAKSAGGDLIRVLGGTAEEVLGGANSQTHVGIVRSKKPISIALERIRALGNRVLKRAA